MTYKLPHGFRTVAVSGQTDVDAPGDGILTLTAGANVTLTTSGTAVTVAASGGGGSSSQSFSVRLAGRFSVSSTTAGRLYTHSSGMGNAMGGDFSLTRTEAGVSDASFTCTAIQAAYYYTIGVAPFACTLESSSMWVQFRYTYTNSPAYRVWKGTYTNGSGGDVTWTEAFTAQSFSFSAVTDASEFITTSPAFAFAAGDLIGLTFEEGGTANTSLNQFTANLMFLET